MKLNLGSGIKRFDGYINIDSDSNCNPDYVINIGKEKFPFDNNSVDEIIAHHIFEHIGDDFLFLIQDMYRVCKHEAIIDVQVPHPRHDYFIGDLTHIRPITIENMKPLSKKWCNTQSYITSSWSGLANILDVDFEIFHYDYVFDETFKELYKDASIEQINWLARVLNNTITEIHFKMMVIK